MKYIKEDLERMIHIENLSYVKIGESYGVSDTYIKKIAIKLGIKLKVRNNNKNIPHNKGVVKEYNCLHCNNCVKRYNKFCSLKCDKDWKFENVTYKKYIDGEINNSKTLIVIYKKINKYYCQDCGNRGEWNGKELSLQVDHIDGNSLDNSPKNLRLLCPNCHTQTDTWGSRNKKKGRRTLLKTKKDEFL